MSTDEGNVIAPQETEELQLQEAPSTPEEVEMKSENSTPPPQVQIRYDPGDEVKAAGTTYVVQRAGNWTRKDPKPMSKKYRSRLKRKMTHGRA